MLQEWRAQLLLVQKPQQVRVSLTNTVTLLIPIGPKLNMSHSSNCFKLNSCFVCRNISCVLCCVCLFGGYAQTASCHIPVDIHWAPCCFEVPVWVTAVAEARLTSFVLFCPPTEALITNVQNQNSPEVPHLGFFLSWSNSKCVGFGYFGLVNL